jgi:hypothetical protein
MDLGVEIVRLVLMWYWHEPQEHMHVFMYA